MRTYTPTCKNLMADDGKTIELTPNLYFADPKPMLICSQVEHLSGNTLDFYKAVRLAEQVQVQSVQWVSPLQIGANVSHFHGTVSRLNVPGTRHRPKDQLELSRERKILPVGTLLMQRFNGATDAWYALLPEQQGKQNPYRVEFNAVHHGDGVKVAFNKRGAICAMFSHYLFEQTIKAKHWKDDAQIAAHSADVQMMQELRIPG